MCVASFVLHTSFVAAFGYASGNHFYLLPLLGGIPLVYPPRHWKPAAVFVVGGLALFITIVLLRSGIPALVEVASETAVTYHALALVAAAVLVAFISYYAHRRTVIAEAQLAERSHALATALAELKAAQAQMIESENQAVLGRLVAGLLHEVNSPLGSVRSAADTITKAVDRCRTFVAGRADREDPDGEAALHALSVSTQHAVARRERVSRRGGRRKSPALRRARRGGAKTL